MKIDNDPSNIRDVIFYIRRYNPEIAPKPFWQEFPVRVEPGMTVLEGLHYIKENHDPGLAVRYSCRMGVCGSCGMLINGRPSLACHTQILQMGNDRLTLASLPNFDIIKDLVPDLRPLFLKHIDMHPYIIRTDKEEMMNPSGELYQHPDELTEYLQFTYCIKCGLCMAACPTVAIDPDYFGPQPLAQGYRYSRDSRDEGFPLRRDSLAGAKGVFRCHYAGECSNVCPKGVDPARAIQLMKRTLVADFLKLKKTKEVSREADKRSTRPAEIPS